MSTGTGALAIRDGIFYRAYGAPIFIAYTGKDLYYVIAYPMVTRLGPGARSVETGDQVVTFPVVGRA